MLSIDVFDRSGASRVDRDQLLAFERIVRVGSFSRAAGELGIAQGTISARIRVLEQEVGGELFVRMGRTIALSEMGRAFLPFAAGRWRCWTRVAAARATAPASRVRSLGLLDSLAGGFAARAIAAFRDEHPAIELEVRAGESDEIAGLLRDGVLTLGLVGWDPPPAGLSALVALRERLVAVASPAHPLARGGPVSLAEVVGGGNPFVLVGWDARFVEAVRAVPHGAGAVVEAPFATARRLLRRRGGVAYLTEDLVADDLLEGYLAELAVSDAPPFERHTALARAARDEPLPPAAEAFVAALRQAAGTMVWDAGRGTRDAAR